jgi:hypothetical protein
VQQKHYIKVRRRYRSASKQYLRQHWHEDDMVMPSHLPYYEPWDSPADGYCRAFHEPDFPDPHHFMWSMTHIDEEKRWEKAFRSYHEHLENYEKYLRK